MKLGQCSRNDRLFTESNRPDLGGTVPMMTENPESRLDLSRDAIPILKNNGAAKKL